VASEKLFSITDSAFSVRLEDLIAECAEELVFLHGSFSD
jgi:hypothetical protein